MSTARSARRSPSLRRLLVGLLVAVGLLVTGLLAVASLQVRGADRQTRAENRRTSSFLIADSLRQSSNDLTNTARLYVATGRERYREHYEEILAIRNGTAPRPRDYDSSFWDRVLAEGKGFVRYGPPQSLAAQMRAARFAPDEFAALQAALRASSMLTSSERAVMARVGRRIDRDGIGALREVRADHEALVSPAYLARKGVIMGAIRRFVALVNARTLREVQRARDHNRDLGRVQLAILAAIVLVGLAAVAVLQRVALRPLGALIAATRRVAGGDYEQRVDVRAVSELERVGEAFNAMASAVQADAEARRDAEHDAVAARLVAEHANRAKTAFLAAMSHEIRTPMIGVTGMLEVLARTDLTPQQRQMVATAEGSASSLLQIIGDILDFTKIEADKLELAPCTFAVRDVVRAAVETFVHTASTKGLLLTWTADDELAEAHVGDPLRLRQIVSNLLSNAVKFTDAGGIEVAVTVPDASPEAQTVQICVSDTGIGISAEQQERLFAEFTQADASTTSRYGGTGLGLVICKRLAQLMGGDIAMQSAPGRGTTMRLTVPLPLGDPAAVAPQAAPALASAQPTSRPKPTREQAEHEGSLLLLAEDHPVNRAVLGHQLDLVGFHVDAAEDGQAAFERWLSGRYALVLTDLNMPRLDGYDLARRIRAHERETGAERTPIIALSANVMQGEPARCREAGMDDFGAKPTTIPFLAGRLQRWLPHLQWPSANTAAPPAAAAPGSGGANGALDPALLDELTGGDSALAAALVDDFLRSTRADLQALDAALGECEPGEVRRQAHRIYGAARIVGAHALAQLAKQLETESGGEGVDWAELGALSSRLGAELDRV